MSEEIISIACNWAHPFLPVKGAVQSITRSKENKAVNIRKVNFKVLFISPIQICLPNESLLLSSECFLLLECVVLELPGNA